jgi:hypothetical protein
MQREAIETMRSRGAEIVLTLDVLGRLQLVGSRV